MSVPVVVTPSTPGRSCVSEAHTRCFIAHLLLFFWAKPAHTRISFVRSYLDIGVTIPSGKVLNNIIEDLPSRHRNLSLCGDAKASISSVGMLVGPELETQEGHPWFSCWLQVFGPRCSNSVR